MSSFVLVCGLSGSGKTTFSKSFVAELKEQYGNFLYVNPDEIYALYNGDERNRKHMFEVWHTLFDVVHAAEMDGRNVLVDSNALTVEQHTQFLEWFPNFNNYICYHVERTKGKRREGNRNRSRNIPESVMDEMEMRYVKPTYDEGWLYVCTVKNNEDGTFVREED